MLLEAAVIVGSLMSGAHGLAMGSSIGGDMLPRGLMGCDTAAPSQAFLALMRRDDYNETEALSIRADGTIQVDAYINVLTTSQKIEDGYLSEDMVRAEIADLNKGFGGVFHFNLKGINRKVHGKWGQGQDMDAMLKQLRRGGYSTLNVYYQTNIQGQGIGYAMMPNGNSNRPGEFDSDGVFIRACKGAGPERGCDLQSAGQVLAHEVGHWLGLAHTFDGGCDGAGDGIDDTPAHTSPSFGCDKPLDTCPGRPGQDPVHNFMNAGPSKCLNQFTNGQKNRMRQAWNDLRSKK